MPPTSLAVDFPTQDCLMDALNDAEAYSARVTFSSDDLPAQLDGRRRYAQWRDLFTARFGCSFELSSAGNKPFSMRCEFARFGGIQVGCFHGTIDRFVRTSRYVDDANDDFVLGLNGGDSDMWFSQLGREGVLGPGDAVLVTNTEAGEIRGKACNRWFAIAIPRRRILDLVEDAEDLVGRPIAACSTPLLHLRRYIDLLLGPQSPAGIAALDDHISTALIDLAVLSFGATQYAAEIAGMRGLRGARLRDAISIIKADFADPAFSPQRLARNMQLSPRYVQELLQEAGATFTERVMELRLQRARHLLSDQRNDRHKVTDIAYACGFNDISYFNRRFRARFGCSPTQYRGGGAV
jgi:AraC-like DNA-binding protein